ncbi:hypothetical protein ACFC4G_41775 [Streptomyces sp. NPDC056002]|uniref:hypothetical protein n=1 Tax=Streptomyces sp. NPDC056002 TaxID=3345675 RepID=UPI0035DDC7EE
MAYEAQAAIRKRRLDARKAPVRDGNAASRARALRKALKAEEAAGGMSAASALREKAARRRGVRRAIAYLSREHGVTAAVGWSVARSLLGGRHPAGRRGRGAGRGVQPVPASAAGAGVPAAGRDAAALRRRARAQALQPVRLRGRPKDQRTEVVKLDFCACETPELVAKIEGREFPAQPSDSFGPSAALYLAQCQFCGGAYKLPWRRAAPTGEPDGTAAAG